MRYSTHTPIVSLTLFGQSPEWWPGSAVFKALTAFFVSTMTICGFASRSIRLVSSRPLSVAFSGLRHDLSRLVGAQHEHKPPASKVQAVPASAPRLDFASPRVRHPARSMMTLFGSVSVVIPLRSLVGDLR